MVAHHEQRGNGGELMSHKIDDLAVAGLEGVENSLAYKAHEIETHLHSRTRRWGAVAFPDETNAIAATVTVPFVAVSGNDDWGAAIPICGTADVPVPTGNVKFDAGYIFVTDTDHATPYKIRIIYGTGTSAAAIIAEQWSEEMFITAAGPFLSGTGVNFQMPRVDVGAKLWCSIWNENNLSEAHLFWGAHGYPG